uniref:OsmC family peroxiredoxin n=1 Tax=Anaerolinea thermolimosa TaxID=229919 RepID=A0A7C4PID5_9CHLR
MKLTTKETTMFKKFLWVTDFSTAAQDTGPSPVQVLLMSLAGCRNITGHEVAKQRGLQLNGIEIKIEGLMKPCSFEERAGFQQIQAIVDVDMPGATQEEIDAWLEETENRCPVTYNVLVDTTFTVTGKRRS